MAGSHSGANRKLPRGLQILGSVVIALHLLAILFLVLAAPSGPWPTNYGSDMAMGPQFASSINNIVSPYYLRFLGMTHNYHFVSNRMATPEIQFEVRLKDAGGNVFKTLRFPQEDANFWVYHRQKILANNLGNDQPVPPRGPEKVAPPSEDIPKVRYWLPQEEVRKLLKSKREVILPENLPTLEQEESPGETDLPSMMDPLGMAPRAPSRKKVNHLVLVSIREDQEGNLPRNGPLVQPPEWAVLVAKSYMRFLCRKHGARSAELVRRSQEPIYPAYMFLSSPPQNAFTEIAANFGDLHRTLGEVHK